MPLSYETVAIPVAKGIDVTTRARLVDNQNLLEAVNSRLSGAGSEKRRGHLSRRVRSTTPLPEGVDLPLVTAPGDWTLFDSSDRGIPESWLFGWGPIVDLETLSRSSALLAQAQPTSPHPDSSLIFGTAERDNETVMWNGFQLLSRLPGQPTGNPLTTIQNAVMPMLRATPVAKAPRAQIQPDAADTGTIRVVTWIDDTSDYSEVIVIDRTAWYSVLDSVTGATIVPPTALDAGEEVKIVRCIPIGGWVHILVSANAAGNLTRFSVHENSPLGLVTESLGPVATYFDFWKTSENSWVVVQNTGSLTTVRVTWRGADGTTDGSFPSGDFGLGQTPTALTSVAICVHPVIATYAIAWRGTVTGDEQVWATEYPLNTGVPQHSVAMDDVDELHRPVAIAPKYLLDETETVFYDVYWDDEQDAGVSIARYWPADESTTYVANRKNLTLASQAMRAGDRTYVWASRSSTLQSTWFLLDAELLPVGHLNYVIAAPPTTEVYTCSMNWYGSAPLKDVLVYHGALGYKVRVPVEPSTLVASNLVPVYAEESIQFLQLDYLPPLRWCQANRCTYFAGAQVWCYDGASLTEAGFHLAPEDVVAGGGVGTNYIYRVDLCHRNAQNEEVRSHSFYSHESTTKGVAFAPLLTRRPDAYALVYRNTASGVGWYLVNSRNPIDDTFILNDLTQTTLTLTDTVLDDGLESREQHPGNSGFGFVEPVAAQACEVISAGHDRIFTAGGELPFGQVGVSRLFQPGETVSFNAFLNIQVDRSVEPITAVGAVGEIVAIFRRNQTYIQEGDGPDNTGNVVEWPPARLALSDVGAVGPESLALINHGLCFQSPAGFRLLGPGGNLQDFGEPVDRVAKSFRVSGCIVVGADQEVRWYSRAAGALVFNYQYNRWSTWTVNAAGVTRNPITGLALIGTPDGFLSEETEGCWRDNNQPFRHRVRFAWLHAGSLLDWQRVRHVGAVGQVDGSDHSVHVDVYFDERDFPGETFDWDYPNDDDDPSWNTDTFGTGTFGSGVFGDATVGASAHEFRDGVWDWTRRLNRQKCSVISVAIDDNYTDGSGFVLTALALEIGQKQGLAKNPWRGGTTTNVHGTTSNGNGR